MHVAGFRAICALILPQALERILLVELETAIPGGIDRVDVDAVALRPREGMFTMSLPSSSWLVVP